MKKVELGKIDIYSKVIHPKTNAPDEQFSIVSVTKQHGVILDESNDKKYEMRGFDISKAKIGYSVNVPKTKMVYEDDRA